MKPPFSKVVERITNVNRCVPASINLFCDLNFRTMPSLLEYLSYNCNFMGILAGPLYTYKDYIAFIEGKTLHVKRSVVNGKIDDRCEHAEPSPVVRF